VRQPGFRSSGQFAIGTGLPQRSRPRVGPMGSYREVTYEEAHVGISGGSRDRHHELGRCDGRHFGWPYWHDQQPYGWRRASVGDVQQERRCLHRDVSRHDESLCGCHLRQPETLWRGSRSVWPEQAEAPIMQTGLPAPLAHLVLAVGWRCNVFLFHEHRDGQRAWFQCYGRELGVCDRSG
jgi:hypothetical protein